jgi:acetyltransferase-like isoleucine patch superfamily enzyme
VRKIEEAIRNPLSALQFLLSIGKGYWYKAKYRFLQKDVTIGKNFRVVKGFRIRGPGRVIIGDNVIVDGTTHAVTPCTYSKEAVIRIGSKVFLNGTRFGCRVGISIGDDCIIGDASILDTDFHHVNPQKRHAPEPPEAQPIIMERNVWIAGATIILKGVTIGENSVVGAGSVVAGDIPKNCLALGNPAQVIRNL